MNHWLFKTEPRTFSWQDLVDSPGSTTSWDGIRNYQARNFMRDLMRTGDPVLFYHSQVSSPCVVGVATVIREGYPDDSQFEPGSRYFDAAASVEDPRWFMVDIRAERALERPVSLKEIRAEPALDGMSLVQKGNRLSIQRVTEQEFRHILKMAARP